ncbi:MAG: SpoIIE family protein phosphatase [Balneolaceae bacterium]|nr:SpoIIE family protein phosphatase [Balneolaceae bacterium]
MRALRTPFQRGKGDRLPGRIAALLALLAFALQASPAAAWQQADFPAMTGDADSVPVWSADDFHPTDSVLSLGSYWRFRAGDSLQWASPSYDASGWEEASTYLGPSELPFLDWEGIGWFRKRLRVDSTLVNHPLALVLSPHNGASEIYLDGELIYHLGEVSVFAEDYRPYRDRRPRPVVLPDTGVHLLAVRYVNHDAQTYLERGYTPGFGLQLGDMEAHLKQALGWTERHSRLTLFFGGLLLAFTGIHFLLFAFYPGEKRNLYFALFTGLLALVTWLRYRGDHTHSPLEVVDLGVYHEVAWLMMLVFALRFAYSLFYKKVPLLFWGFLAAGVLLAGASWSGEGGLASYHDFFVLAVLLEIGRVLAVSFWHKRQGVWIIGTGLFCFTGGMLYTSLVNLNMVAGDPVYGGIYGAILLIFTMSVFLSRDFARTQRRLEHKLIEVKHLSERSLEQERMNKKKELERKLLEAENERKTRELEEARALQLSMLPKNLPESSHWDIAVFMETAQEVGGDYYDFSLDKNGQMTVALGDATGHGMKAGIIVATAKSYFHTLAGDRDNLDLLRRMSSGIRNMDLKLLYMGMTLVNCRRHRVEITAAGMPPILVYRSAPAEVETVTIKGMPLGTRIDYPYENRELQLQPGDVMLLMSDGLMELFNEQRELLGLNRIRQAFEEVAESPANNILSRLNRLIDQWSGRASHEDDITILVMKAR